MSQQATRTAVDVPEIVVRCRGQHSECLHRPGPEDSAEPACKSVSWSDREFTDVPAAAYHSWPLCRNPECFGGER